MSWDTAAKKWVSGNPGNPSAIGYVTPADTMAGRERAIFAERDRKLDAARRRRRAARAASRAAV